MRNKIFHKIEIDLSIFSWKRDFLVLNSFPTSLVCPFKITIYRFRYCDGKKKILVRC